MPLTLLAVFAHPDDESFACGGTLTRYESQGVRVVSICATRGEVGMISDPERLFMGGRTSEGYSTLATR